MNRIIFLCIMASLILFSNVHAERTISLPYSTTFDTDDLSDIAWTDCGATVTHSSTGGWSGGAVKMTPPTSACSSGNGGMSTIGEFLGFSETRINVRFLIKFGSTYVANKQGGVNKFIDVHSSGGTRFGILGLHLADGPFMAPAVAPYPSAWYVFRSPGTEEADHDSANATIKWTDASLGGEWYCFEYEINAAGNTTTFYLTKSDGTQQTVTSETSVAGNMYTLYIGGYHNGYGTADANNYLLIDNLVISNTYIGPPEGFVGGSTPSRKLNNVTGVRVTLH